MAGDYDGRCMPRGSRAGERRILTAITFAQREVLWTVRAAGVPLTAGSVVDRIMDGVTASREKRGILARDAPASARVSRERTLLRVQRLAERGLLTAHGQRYSLSTAGADVLRAELALYAEPDGWRWLEPGERIQRGDWTDIGGDWREVEPHEEGREIVASDGLAAVRWADGPPAAEDDEILDEVAA